MDHSLTRPVLLELLEELGEALDEAVTITLVGGSAGLLINQLSTTRTTVDCDVIRTEPPESFSVLRAGAVSLAKQRGLPDDWLSDQVAELDVLPSGWRKRRIEVGVFGRLRVWSVGRLDLLAMKVYAGRMQDRADVADMKPDKREISFIRRYLDQLRVPSRQANLDQIQSAFRFLDAIEESP
jgi:hypothetical protein